MSRRRQRIVRAEMQRGRSLDEARSIARSRVKRKRAHRMVDARTSVTIQDLSVRPSRAKRQARYFGADARLVRT